MRHSVPSAAALDMSRFAEVLGEAARLKDQAIDRAAYAADASHYLLTPAAVVLANSVDEVACLLRTASDTASPVTFRSGGTSLSGQSATQGLLIDVRCNFRGLEILDDGGRVRVQPGMTLANVNARLARYGVRLGPDPASETACTIGGIIANNSSGMACGTVQNTYQTLESMTFVLPSGTVIDTASTGAEDAMREQEPHLWEGLLNLRDRVRGNPHSVELIRRQFALKNTMGYGVNAFLDFDTAVEILAHLIIGSEGTLAFVAEAVFRTVPVHQKVSTGLAIFPTLEHATTLLPELVASDAATLELMDSSSLRVGQSLAGAPQEILGFSPAAEAALLIEYRADTDEHLQLLSLRGSSILGSIELSRTVQFQTDPVLRSRAWTFRKGLYASIAGARPSGTTALLEDVVVPPRELSAACTGLQELFRRYGYEDSVIFGHAKDGNIHFMLTDRFEGGPAVGRYLEFTEQMVDLVLSAGGNLKAEHGTGRAMAPYVRRQYGDELYGVMRHLKDLCDPVGIMNPGVILDEDPQAHIQNIKLPPPVEEEVDRCVECGYCEPVCPSRDLTLTPRQRIVVRRAMETARMEGDTELAAELEEQYEYQGLQTCAADGMCQIACPVLIDTGSLVKRLRSEQSTAPAEKAWKAAARSWGPATRGAATALTLAERLPEPLTKGATDIPRSLLGRTRGPELIPQYSADLPAGGVPRRRLTGVVGEPSTVPQAIYLPACVNSMFGPAAEHGATGGVGGAFRELLEAAGISVLVPEGIESLCCGTPWSSKGHTAGYELNQNRTVRRVLDVAQENRLPVISDASSCTEGFAQLLSSHPDANELVVEDVVAFTVREVLPRLPHTKKLTSLVLHPTCSSRQMGLDADLNQLARTIADEVHTPYDWGCCAFAGDRGMLHPELTAAATAHEAAEVTTMASQAHASCNRTCEMGMTRATGRDYRHILEYLAEQL